MPEVSPAVVGKVHKVNVTPTPPDKKEERVTVAVTPKGPDEVTPKPEQPRPARRETVSLTYHGILKRTDGKTLALIEDSKSKRSAFYESETELFDVKIGGITTLECEIVQPGGEPVTLKLGEPEVFEDGRHID
jgi:hypothetical protein